MKMTTRLRLDPLFSALRAVEHDVRQAWSLSDLEDVSPREVTVPDRKRRNNEEDEGERP